jgi:hypothetical protein
VVNWRAEEERPVLACEVIIALFRVTNQYVGNLPPMPGVFPDYPAPVVRNAAGEREIALSNFRFGAHYGLESDIASGPKCAHERSPERSNLKDSAGLYRAAPPVAMGWPDH